MATTASGGRPSMRSPAKLMLPVESFTRPEIARSVVVLPAPLAPMMVTIERSSTARLMLLSAATELGYSSSARCDYGGGLLIAPR
jgi:hypothetical protein